MIRRNLLCAAVRSDQARCRHGLAALSIVRCWEFRTLTTGITTNEDGGSKSRLKSFPVDPSILKHIESIGVGKQKRRTSPRRKTHREKSNVLTAKGEEAFFRQRQTVTDRSRRCGGGSTHRSSWLPPPPFSTFQYGNKSDESDNQLQDSSVVRLPVKVVGSVGSLNETMPRPTKGLPEVALAGRSNVGKSTLLNALLYGNQPSAAGTPHRRQPKRGRARKTPEGKKIPRGAKAITSNLPGETKQITFYQLSAKQHLNHHQLSLMLVDLPGYGFAYASQERAAEWGKLMKQYILGRGKALKRVLLLVDARHGMKKADVDFLVSLESTAPRSNGRRKELLPPIQIVLTKCDLVSQVDLARRVVQVRQQLSDTLRRQPSSLPVMLVSAKAGVGYNAVVRGVAQGGVLELQRDLAALVPPPDTRNSSKKKT